MVNRARHWLWNILCVLSLAACAATVVAWKSDRLHGFGISSGDKEYRLFTLQSQLRLHVLELAAPKATHADESTVRRVRRVAAVPCWAIAALMAMLPGWRCYQYLRRTEWSQRAGTAFLRWARHDSLRGFGVFLILTGPFPALTFDDGKGGVVVILCGCVLVGGSMALETLARATREQRGFEVIVHPQETETPASTDESEKDTLEQSAGRE